MIKVLTTTTDVSLDGDDLRENAFSIYQNFLKKYDSNKLMLLESLGINSVDSRVSMVGVNPVITVNVKNKIVSIHGSPELLQELKIDDSIASLQSTSSTMSVFELTDKKKVWKFLKEFEKNFVQVPAHECGILTFSCFSYETIHYIETIAETGLSNQDDHDITLILYQAQFMIEENKAELITYSIPGVKDLSVKELVDSIARIDCAELMQDKAVNFEVTQETGRSDYLNKAKKALHHVTIGDIYQVQIGQKIQIKADIKPIDVYQRLRNLNPSPYMYLFSINDQTVIGASPELFLRISKDEEILMRPIAGTLGKKEGLTLHDATQHLQADKKEVAEHMMLVDLCRNDIYRVCNTNSLKVSGLLEIEEYSHVYHMVSTTKATLRPDLDKYDVIVASFPAGTMTGTPKVRAMQIIAELEDSQRGKYAGAIGMLGIGTNYINTALCIRSTVEKNQVYTLRASAGIVSDSQENSEYPETLHKMGSMFKAITGGGNFMPCRVIVVDAYDSFVHILVSYFEQVGCDVNVLRKDDPGLLSLIDPIHSDIIVLGPGPGHPSQSGYDTILKKNAGRLPVFGVCLGHQAIGLYYGCIIEYANNLMHGKTSMIKHDGKGCYSSLNNNAFKVMRYHSIIVANRDIPNHMVVTSHATDDNYIMGLRHQSLPIESVQFHPESIGTDDGLKLIRNFINNYATNRKELNYEKMQQSREFG